MPEIYHPDPLTDDAIDRVLAALDSGYDMTIDKLVQRKAFAELRTARAALAEARVLVTALLEGVDEYWADLENEYHEQGKGWGAAVVMRARAWLSANAPQTDAP